MNAWHHIINSVFLTLEDKPLVTISPCCISLFRSWSLAQGKQFISHARIYKSRLRLPVQNLEPVTNPTPHPATLSQQRTLNLLRPRKILISFLLADHDLSRSRSTQPIKFPRETASSSGQISHSPLLHNAFNGRHHEGQHGQAGQEDGRRRCQEQGEEAGRDAEEGRALEEAGRRRRRRGPG